MKKVSILGIQFDNITLQEAVQFAMDRIRRKEKGYVVTPNAEIAYLCKEDAALKNLANGACLVLPDGIGIVYAAKLLKQPLSGKVAGVDFAARLLEQLGEAGKSVYLLGAKPGVAEEAAKRIKQNHPGIVIVGYRDGYFKKDSEAVQAVNAAGYSDVTFVCLGAPKQERFMAEHLSELNSTLLCGLGGSLDVFAGNVNRAPDIFIKLGLEWFYRLLKEPKRIGRMMTLPKFMITVLGQKISKRED